ncbi:MAG: peptide MFS transporter [Pseudomonadota bacterium]
MSEPLSERTATPTERTFLGHPRGLVILFLTEMWERFSFYGMRGLLIIYLTQHFLFSDQKSALIYGTYLALVYVMTIIGGTLADRYLGSRKAVTFGAILLVLGHFGMAFEGEGSRDLINIGGVEYQLALDGRGGDAGRELRAPNGAITAYSLSADGSALELENPQAVGLPARIELDETTRRIEAQPLYQNILYLSLALIIAGVGYLKANISTIVGALYEEGDARRDSGFTIYYMGINLGSALASLGCGYLGIVYGWKWGFGLAGVGMLLGLIFFLAGQSWLEGRAEPPDAARLRDRVLGPITVEAACYLTGIAVIAVAMFFILNPESFGGVMLPLGLLLLGYMLYYALRKCDTAERDRMLAALYFILAQIPFWALFEQAGSSLNLFTDRLVDRELLGWSVPAPIFQSINAIFIFTFAPLLAWLWIALDRRKLDPSTPVKFAFGVLLAGLGFLALVAGMRVGGADALTPVIFIFLIYWIHTMGELLVSPVGLSAVTKLAPARVVGMTMGAWFLYGGFSNYLSGIIARSTGAETIGGQITNIAAAKAGYAEVYTNVGYWAIGISAGMLLISPVIKRLMRGA